MNHLLVLSLLAVSPLESEAAFRDLTKFDAITQQSLVYLSLSDVPEKERDALAKTVAFVVPSLSNKPNMTEQLPQRLVESPNLLRLNLSELGWEGHYQSSVIQHYPYRPDITRHTKSFPIVVSALWFVAQATDPNETGDMYYQLLYSGKPPKTLKEFHAFWHVQKEASDFVGFVEGQSGVNIAKHRLIENHPSGNRGSSWSTYDSGKITADKDPLENLVPGSLKFDVGEHFATIPKRTLGETGLLLAPFLADNKGNRQEVAPASIVSDNLATRTNEIRQFVSCVGCHAAGINPPTLNEYSSYITSGAKVYAKDKNTKQSIEAYLQSNFNKELLRTNEDYEAAIKMANGMRPIQNSEAYIRFVQKYDKEVDQAQAALEMGVTEKTLSLAIAYYATVAKPPYSDGIPARVVALAHGKPMPRKRWELEFYNAYLMVQNFQREK